MRTWFDADRDLGPYSTVGWIDSVQVEGGRVRVDGWIDAVDGPRIDQLALTWSGVPVALDEMVLGLPSPDVASVHPALAHGGACRFRLGGKAPSEACDVLVALRPGTGERSGRRLFSLVQPRLPFPPQSLVDAVGGGFLEVSLDFLDRFLDVGRLERDDRVLDVGCGFGRQAFALAYHLSDRATYHGFDVMPDAIAWASRHITPLRPRFTFQYVDVYNGLYNTSSRLPCDRFLFPFDDGSFDFVFLTSVFTHMVGRDVRHYLDEIARVLAPTGRAVVTAFVLTEEARGLVADGRTKMMLTIPYGDGFVADRTAPEGAIGFEDLRLIEWIEERSLRVTTVLPGSWCGRASRLGYQDLLLLEPA